MNRSVARSHGFTLLEVMITVCIVAILAAIALPAYQDSVRRGKMIDGTVRLGDFRAQQEKWFLDNRTYQKVPAAGTACGIDDPPLGATDPFKLECDAPTATTYNIKATGQSGGGMPGIIYNVNQANVRSTTGSGGWTGSGSCWSVRKDGTCQ